MEITLVLTLTSSVDALGYHCKSKVRGVREQNPEQYEILIFYTLSTR